VLKSADVCKNNNNFPFSWSRLCTSVHKLNVILFLCLELEIVRTINCCGVIAGLSQSLSLSPRYSCPADWVHNERTDSNEIGKVGTIYVPIHEVPTPVVWSVGQG